MVKGVTDAVVAVILALICLVIVFSCGVLVIGMYSECNLGVVLGRGLFFCNSLLDFLPRFFFMSNMFWRMLQKVNGTFLRSGIIVEVFSSSSSAEVTTLGSSVSICGSVGFVCS